MSVRIEVGEWGVARIYGKVAHCIKRLSGRGWSYGIAHCNIALYPGDLPAAGHRRCARCERREARRMAREGGA